MSDQSLMEIFALHASAQVALRSGLLAHLARAPASAADAARSLGLDASGVALVLEVLRTAGLLDDDAGSYRLRADVRRELAGPGGHADMNARVWDGTEALVATGRTMLGGELTERGAVYTGAVGRLGDMFGEAAARLARQLAPALPDGARLLDVGAGSGIWSLSVLKERADVRATGLDLAAVLPRFEETAAALGVAPRSEVMAGNFLSVPVPERRYDAVIFANVLHLEPAPRARALLQRFVQGLTPAGRLVIVDALPDPDPRAERRR
ncbi:MAG: class I SAM-dependent methyltransferase, partial [Myxococcales bacterium]